MLNHIFYRSKSHINYPFIYLWEIFYLVCFKNDDDNVEKIKIFVRFLTMNYYREKTQDA